VQAQIKAASATWLQQVATGLLDEAYAQIVPESMGVDERAWKDVKRSFRAMAGEPVQLAVWRVTVYDNPPGASAPGLYVAADYNNEYSKLALQCGYLMWHRPAGGEFRIMREETGNITAQELKSIPAADFTAIKRRFHCAP
jgi:hypothetical protein